MMNDHPGGMLMMTGVLDGAWMMTGVPGEGWMMTEDLGGMLMMIGSPGEVQMMTGGLGEIWMMIGFPDLVHGDHMLSQVKFLYLVQMLYGIDLMCSHVGNEILMNTDRLGYLVTFSISGSFSLRAFSSDWSTTLQDKYFSCL